MSADAVMKANRRYTIIRIALWVFACVVAFAAAEVALRVYPPFQMVVTGNRIVLAANREYTFETSASLHLPPEARTKLDPIIVHTKNSLGFRGPEPPSDPLDTLTIVTVGGSTTECFYLSDGKTWPDLLAAALSNAFSPVWLNNAGLDGHSTVGHTVLLEDYLVPLKPKVVLFLFGVNDVYVEQALAFDRASQRSGLDFRSLKGLLVSAANYSRVLAVPLNLYRDARAERLGVAHTLADLRALPQRRVPEDAGRDALLRLSRGLPAFEERIERLIAISRRHGIEPVFLTQPVLYGDGVDPASGMDLGLVPVGELNGTYAWQALERFNDVTRRVGEREGVLVVDLAAKLPKNSDYYYDVFHYSNAGAARVAGIVRESLCPHLAAKFPRFLTGHCDAATPEQDAAARPSGSG